MTNGDVPQCNNTGFYDVVIDWCSKLIMVMRIATDVNSTNTIGTVVAISIHCDVKISLHVVVVLILLVLHQLITMPSKLDTVFVLL